MKRPHQLILGLMATLAAPAAVGETGDLRRCAELESDAKRLACYDAVLREEAVDRPSEQQPPIPEPSEPAAAKATAPAPAPRVEPAPAAEARFGLEAPSEPAQPAKDVKELAASITEIKVRRNGERIFTLDNGQVWAEKSPSPSLHLEVGDRVTIRSGLFGSHRLFGSGKRSSGVDRVR